MERILRLSSARKSLKRTSAPNSMRFCMRPSVRTKDSGSWIEYSQHCCSADDLRKKRALGPDAKEKLAEADNAQDSDASSSENDNDKDEKGTDKKMSEYELTKNRNIAENKALLAKLGLASGTKQLIDPEAKEKKEKKSKANTKSSQKPTSTRPS